MSFDDPPPLFLVDVERPLAPLGSSAEDESVGARHHVDTDTRGSRRDMDAAVRSVIDVRLGCYGRELSFERDELVIPKEILGAETGAIDDDRRAQRHEIPHGIEFTDHDPRTIELNVFHERVEIDGILGSGER